MKQTKECKTGETLNVEKSIVENLSQKQAERLNTIWVGKNFWPAREKKDQSFR
jgi:hypothetical protein